MINLYRQSRSEAEKYNELDFWEKSHAENIRCRDAIDTAIKDNYNGKRLDVKGAKKVLAGYGYDRTMWVLSASILNKTYDGRFSHDNKEWARSMIPNYISKEQFREYASDSHPAVLDGFVSQVKREYDSLGLVGHSQCKKSQDMQDYEDKLLILKPEVLSDQFKTPVNQYFYATGGFGCSPEKSGKKVFGEFLSDGEKTHFYREDFIGVADKEQLPDWAKEKLQQLETPSMKIRVFQIDHEKDLQNLAFMNYEVAQNHGGVNPSVYRQVYGGTVACSSLEQVFAMCNSQHPAGYFGESMSVSNVVEVCNGNQKGCYFVDSVGFKPIEFDITQTNYSDLQKILVVENGKEPYVAEIQNCYKARSSVVNGLIEAVYFEPKHDAIVFCNEEFLLNGSEPNRLVGDTLIHGTFYVVGNTQNEYGEWESCSLTDEQISKYSQMFAEPIQEISLEEIEGIVFGEMQ